MKKEYIKMNNNDYHLSLGNLFRIIKEMSKNKSSALQSEIFCILFNVDEINDTTVNNYCVGCRGIGNDYKQIYLNNHKKYLKDNTLFEEIIINILSIIDGKVYIIDKDRQDFINNNESMKLLCKNLYNIAKNDKSVNNDLIIKLSEYKNTNKFYKMLIELLFFIILYKKQPLYDSDIKKDVIDNLLNDTYMSSNGLEEYLSIKLRESINYDYALKQLASNNNAYACFELGSNEYCGYVIGTPRYERAYEYFIPAAKKNHAGACYMIANMYYHELIGTKSKYDMEKCYEFLIKAESLGNIAALNILGLMYMYGEYPLNKNVDKAVEYFEKASNCNYAYSLNNLGKIYESKDSNKAFEYYLKSANLGESWACNKVGEYYKNGIIVLKDDNVAIKYYKEAIESNYRTLCFYAYYNLALYYKNGCVEANISKDINKSIEYFKIASQNNVIEASIELFIFYVNEYLNKRESMNVVNKYKNIIETNPKYNNEIKLIIENKLKEIANKKEIDLKDI